MPAIMAWGGHHAKDGAMPKTRGMTDPIDTSRQARALLTPYTISSEPMHDPTVGQLFMEYADGDDGDVSDHAFSA